MSNRFGIGMNLKRLAAWQVRNFPFNSMCVFNGNPIAASEDGIFTLDTGDDDNGTEIDAVVELVTTTFNYLGVKRFRKAYVGYEASGDLTLTITIDQYNTKVYTLTNGDINQLQHRDVLDMTRDLKGVYWQWRIENIDGCDFSIDLIEGLPIYLHKGHR